MTRQTRGHPKAQTALGVAFIVLAPPAHSAKLEARPVSEINILELPPEACDLTLAQI